MGIELDDRYQTEAYETIKKSIEENRKVGIVLPPGTGKTYLALKLIEDNLDIERILFLSSSPKVNAYVRKTIRKNYDSEQAEKILSKIKFVTYKGLSRRYKKNKDDLGEYKSDLIIIDEVHRSGAPEWGKAVDYLLNNNSETKMLGMTATPLRTDGQNMIEKRFGNVAYELKLSEAVARGIIKLPLYISSRYIFEEDIQSLQEKIDSVADLEKKKEFQEKLNRAKKQIANSKGKKEIFKKYMTKKNGKWFVFCNPGDDIILLQEQAKREGWFCEINKDQTFLMMEYKQNDYDNNRALRTFLKTSGDDLRILFSKNMINEGIHDEEATGEIMLRPTKSYVLFMQQLGRILSRNRNETPIVLDLVGNIKYFKEFRQEIINIIRKGTEEGDTRYDPKVLGQFKILEEQEDFVKSFEEIEKTIDEYTSRTVIEETIDILEKLYNEGINVAKMQRHRNTEEKRGVTIVLSEIKNKNIQQIIENNNIDPNYPIGNKVERMLYLYRNTDKLTDEIIRRIENLGFEKERRTTIDETLDILEILKKEGIDVTKIQRLKTVNGKSGVGVVLSEIDNRIINTVIEKYNLDPNYPIGKRIEKLLSLYRETSYQGDFSKRHIERIKELGFKKKNSEVSKILDLLEDLNNNGINVSEMVRTKAINGKTAFKCLFDIECENIDEIIKKHGLKSDYPVGQKIGYVIRGYNGGVNITADEKKRIEELGLIKEKPTSIEELLGILEKLSTAGVDVSNIKQSKETRINGKRKSRTTYLYEIDDDDIEQIINNLELDRMYPVGVRLQSAKSAYRGNISLIITDENKSLMEKLGLVSELDKKEAKQNALGKKKEASEKLKNEVFNQLEKKDGNREGNE